MKLEFEHGEAGPGAGALTDRCFVASLENKLAAGEGQGSGHKPGRRLVPIRLPHQETPGLSCLCDAVSSC